MTKSTDIRSWFLWEDEDLIAINKPAGLLTIQDGYDALQAHLRQILTDIFGKIYIIHRLDKETSGVILIAKNQHSHRHLSTQFQKRTIQKEYHAIIHGIPEWEKITENTPLLVNGDRRHRTIGHPAKGKDAETDFLLLKTGKNHSLIGAHPHTGYRHQIRAHLRLLSLSILTDALYAVPGPTSIDMDPPAIKRLALHANEISFKHPSSGDLLRIHAPYPQDFIDALSSLRII